MQRLYYSEEYLAGIHIIAVSDGKALKKVLLNSALPSNLQADISYQTNSALFETLKQLKEYFFNGRKDFSLPLNPEWNNFSEICLGSIAEHSLRKNYFIQATC